MMTVDCLVVGMEGPDGGEPSWLRGRKKRWRRLERGCCRWYCCPVQPHLRRWTPVEQWNQHLRRVLVGGTLGELGQVGEGQKLLDENWGKSLEEGGRVRRRRDYYEGDFY